MIVSDILHRFHLSILRNWILYTIYTMHNRYELDATKM